MPLPREFSKNFCKASNGKQHLMFFLIISVFSCPCPSNVSLDSSIYQAVDSVVFLLLFFFFCSIWFVDTPEFVSRLPFGLVFQLVCLPVALSSSWSGLPVGLSSSWSVFQLVCLPVGLSSSWSVFQLVCLPVGLSSSWYVFLLVWSSSWSVFQLVCLPVGLVFQLV